MKKLYSCQEAIHHIISDKHEFKVVLMCGLAGSGKTTFSRKLEIYNFLRLSVDEEIWATYGKYDIDYPKKEYESFQAKATEILLERFYELLEGCINIVVDLSFWQKQNRDEFKRIIESKGGKWFLVYMDTPIPVIRKRLASRNKRFDANSAFPITNSMLNKFISTFEIPEDEGQVNTAYYNN